MRAKVISNTSRKGEVFEAKPTFEDPQMKKEISLRVPMGWAWYGIDEVEILPEEKPQ